MGIPIQSVEESLSLAYINAIVSRAGATTESVPKDYGVDVSVRRIQKFGTQLMDMGVAFDCQLKATINWSIKDEHLIYDVEVDTFNKLIFRQQNSSSPCLLVIFCLPREKKLWLSTTDEGLVLRKCCYYYQLRGDFTSNGSKKRIKIPIENKLTPEAVERLIIATTTGELQ